MKRITSLFKYRHLGLLIPNSNFCTHKTNTNSVNNLNKKCDFFYTKPHLNLEQGNNYLRLSLKYDINDDNQRQALIKKELAGPYLPKLITDTLTSSNTNTFSIQNNHNNILIFANINNIDPEKSNKLVENVNKLLAHDQTIKCDFNHQTNIKNNITLSTLIVGFSSVIIILLICLFLYIFFIAMKPLLLLSIFL